MTSEELQAIKSRIAGASDGPWSVRRIPNSYDSPVGDRYTHPCVRGFRVPRRLYNLAWQQVEADAEFMAQARQDVPALVAEVERLRAIVKECSTALTEILGTRQVTPEAVARVEQYLSEEQVGWDSGRRGEVRRLFLGTPKMRPKEASAGAGKVAPFPVRKTR
jgi:hypothetical protein